MPRSRRRPEPPQAPPPLEWVGGRLPTPFYITGADPLYRPEMVLRVELPSELIVAGDVLKPNAPKSLGRALLEAFKRPLAGPPRRPRRIRVATAAEAAEVRAAVGPAIEVAVAPTPELATVMEAMAEGISGNEKESYFEGGRVPRDRVADLFAAARALHAAAPWKRAAEEQTLRMDIPALGVEGACVSIIGALGQSLGLIIFPSQMAFHAFAGTADAGPLSEGPVDLGTTMLSLTFERAGRLPPSMRREALEHGWRVAGPDAYPRVEHRDKDGVSRPLTERDVRIATACALAVTAFTTSHGQVFSADHFEPVSVTFTGHDQVAVRLTAPGEAADLSEPEPQLGLFATEGAEPRRRAAAAPGATGGGPPTGGRSRLARNQPCWCGSGKKYQRCHLAADRAADAAQEPQQAQPAPIHAVDERLVNRMARFAKARFGARWLRSASGPFRIPSSPRSCSCRGPSIICP